MRQAAVEAYRRGQLHFADLMLARQTYASLKTEDIQIRQEIVNAHLAGLRELGNPDERPMPNTPSPGPANLAPTPAAHLLGSPDGTENSKPATMENLSKDSSGSEPAIPQSTPTLVTGNGVGEAETK
jgi:hypothetical protein